MDLTKTTNYHYAKYMWTHLFCYAMKDVFVVYHSPAGCKKKAEFTISPNDINFDTEHYFDNYINNTESVFWTEKSLIDALEKILSKNQFKVIYIITTDVAEIIWFDINQVINVINSTYPDVKLIYLKWQAIWWNMFEWYSEALNETLLSLNIHKKSLANSNLLNIFWYFFTRNEWDFEWDMEEFQKILWDLWIELNVFSWYSSCEDFSKINLSNKSIIFPYADSSKEILETKYSQKVEFVDFPIWIQNTIKFINKIWELFDIKTLNYIDKELKRIIPRINKIEHIILGKKFWIVWDSQRLNPLLDLLLDVWMRPEFIIYLDDFKNSENFITKLKNKYNYINNIDIFVDIDRNRINEIINDKKYWIDLLIWSSIEKYNLNNNIAFLEFFFPCITRHFINKHTSVWFNWVLNILNDIYNLLNKPEYYNLSNSLWNLMWDFSFYYAKNEK